MRSRRSIGWGLALLLVTLTSLSHTAAEEVEKRWRFGFAAGAFNHTDEIASDSGNVLVVLNPDESLNTFYIDPRDDSGVFGNLDIQSGPIGTLYGQYAVNRFFIVEASVGYQKTDLGDVEVQAQLEINSDFPDTQNFNFQIFRIQAGEIERVPVQLTGLVRFRPRAQLNPYLGAGIGYSFVGFEPTAEMNELSRNMDNSLGVQTVLSEALFGTDELSVPNVTPQDLTGATVDARDTFEWHLAGGAELSFKKNWSVFLDLRWVFASRSVAIGFNGGESLGISVPQFTDILAGQERGQTVGEFRFGAVSIRDGGLVDGGSLVPPANDPDVDCATQSQLCVYSPELDGELDTGLYYVQGGEVDYGGLGMQFGFRVTF